VRLGVIHSVGPSWHSRAGAGSIGASPWTSASPPVRREGRCSTPAAVSSASRPWDPAARSGHPGLYGRSGARPAALERTGRTRLARCCAAAVLVPEALQAEAGQSQGLMVMSVSKDGPAARANLHAGDILVKIAGESVTSPTAVAQYLGPHSVGKEVELHLIRADKPFSIPVTVGIRPDR